MDDTTLTDDKSVDTGSSDANDASLLDDNDNKSAVGTDDNDSSNDASSDSDDSADDAEDDKNFAKFAKSQGIDDVDSLTDREKQLLKVAHDNVKDYRKDAEKKANDKKLTDELNDMSKSDKDDGINEVIAKKVARMEVKEAIDDFWDENQEDRKYEAQMTEILQEEREKYGDDAARMLFSNLPRLLREAKFKAGAFDTEAAKEAARKEEREKLRKTQEGAADGAHASSSSSASSDKVTREWVENTYDPNNEEHRKLLDDAITRGDLY